MDKTWAWLHDWLGIEYLIKVLVVFLRLYRSCFGHEALNNFCVQWVPKVFIYIVYIYIVLSLLAALYEPININKGTKDASKYKSKYGISWEIKLINNLTPKYN